MHPIEMVIYFLQSLLSQHGTQRFWFWGLPSVHRPGSPRDCRKLDGTEQGKFLSCSFIQDGNRCAVEEVVMLRKRKEPKAKKSVLETLMRDMQGIAAEKLVLFERLKAAGAFVHEPAAELAKAEKTLQGLAAMEKKE